MAKEKELKVTETGEIHKRCFDTLQYHDRADVRGVGGGDRDSGRLQKLLGTVQTFGARDKNHFFQMQDYSFNLIF